MTPWLLPLLPAVAGLVVLPGPAHRGYLGAVAALALAATLALAAAAAGQEATLAWSGALQLRAGMPPQASVMAVLVPAVALPVCVYAAAHEHAAGLRRLIGLLLLFCAGMELLLIAADLLTLLIAWELVGACSWALIAHRWQAPEAGAAGSYAFVITRAGDLGLFVAAMAAYAGSGSFDYAALVDLPPSLLVLVAAGVLMAAAAKSGQLPFSPWLFRAMAGPTSVSALLHAAAMVAAGAWLLVRLQPAFAALAWFGAATMVLGLATALCGGLVALLQTHAKKLLAASTSAHFGLMFAAVGAGYPLVALLHLLTHAAFKAPLFLAAGTAGERAGHYELPRLRLGRSLPAVAAFSAVAALALAGLPPLGGGWSKEAIAGAVAHRGPAPALLAMLAGGLSAAYALRFQWLAFGRGTGTASRGRAPGTAERAAIGTLALACLLLGVLWLAPLRDRIAIVLAGEIPASPPGEQLLSLLFVLAGLVLGAVSAHRWLAPTAAAEWLGLPRLIERLFVGPVTALSQTCRRVDEALLDAPVSGIAAFGLRAARGFARFDARAVERGARGAAGLARAGARLGAGPGERLSDGVPASVARLVSFGGRIAPRLQGGLAHQYYSLIVVAAALLGAMLILGS